MEVRLQGWQVDREDALRRAAAGEHVAEDGAAGVRLLRQREPAGRSPTVEPGARAAAARGRKQHTDADVQRLWRPGRQPLHGTGSPQELLKPIAVLKAVAFAAALLPAAALVYGYYTNDLTANPGDYLTDQTGTWTLAMLVISLTVTPLRRITKWNELIKLRRMLGLFAFFYGTLHMLTWVVFFHFFDLTFMIEDVGMRPYITIGMGTFLILFV